MSPSLWSQKIAQSPLEEDASNGGNEALCSCHRSKEPGQVLIIELTVQVVFRPSTQAKATRRCAAVNTAANNESVLRSLH
jgi:hypothetical protein